MKFKNRRLEVKKANQKIDEIEVDFEVKQIIDTDEEYFIFEGLASTFGNVDLTNDIVEPGAFRESLAVKTPIVLWQHRSSEPIGMPEEIRETPEGLFLRARLPRADTLVSGRVIPQVTVGSVRKMSIGFRTLEDARDQDNPRIRRIKKVDLVEVSLVTFPANPQAAVTGFKDLEGNELDPLNEEEIKMVLRHRAGEPSITVDTVKEITTQRDFEKVLRESGFSKDAACMMAKHFQGEPDESEMAIKAIRSLNSSFEDHDHRNVLKSMFDKLEKQNG